MKSLIPINDYGLFADKSERVLVDSRFVAERLNKRHDNVIRDIREKILPYVSDDFNVLNFEEIKYKDSRNRKQIAYVMTEEGFNFLIFSYNDKSLYPYKEAYYKRFKEMQAYLQTYVSVRDEFPQLTKHVQMIYGDSKLAFHCIHEQNMLYKFATGLTAAQIRKRHGLPERTVVRPYLTHEELELFDMFHKIDIGLLVSTPNYYDRKEILQQYKDRYAMKYQLVGA